VPASAAKLLASLCVDWRLVLLRGPHLLLQVAPEQTATAVNMFAAELAAERTQ
jgi:hypothetical protein